MTKLQREMLDAVRKVGEFGAPIAYVEACEEVAKRYIENAFNGGRNSVSKNEEYAQTLEEWLKENGATGEVNS